MDSSYSIYRSSNPSDLFRNIIIPDDSKEKEMNLSKKGLELIKEHEQFRNNAYIPVKGDRWTIGWGNTFYSDGKPVQAGDWISQKKGAELLLTIVGKFESGVRNLVNTPINQNQFDALVSFTYNVGLEAFRTSTLLKKINKDPDDETIGHEFSRWNKSSGIVYKGLIKRRNSEYWLYNEHNREKDNG